MSKLSCEEFIVTPIYTISETMQAGVVFYMLAIKTNKNSILLFDEPESNTFPILY